MNAVHEIPYWKEIRARNFRDAVLAGYTRLEPDERKRFDLFLVFLGWCRGFVDGSPLDIVHGALIMALYYPEGPKRMVHYLAAGLRRVMKDFRDAHDHDSSRS